MAYAEASCCRTGFAPLLRTRGFAAVLAAQFLGGLNDNALKMIVSLLIMRAATARETAGYGLAFTGTVFVLPFILFAGYAGQASDRFSKTLVLQLAKTAEVLISSLGLFALYTQRLEPLFGVLFILAIRGAFFSPAVAGLIPEILPRTQLSRANGLLSLTSFAAIVLGSGLGSFFMALWEHQHWKLGVALVAIACTGAISSLYIPIVPRPRGAQPLHCNPFSEVVNGLRSIKQNPALNLAVFGTAYFWFVGALLQMTILLFCVESFHSSNVITGSFMTALAVGIGFGSLSAALISKDRIELGLVPCACLSLGILSLFLTTAQSVSSVILLLVGIGFSGGLFIVPLNASLQQRSPPQKRGQILTTTSLINMLGVILASGTFWLLRDGFHCIAPTVVAIEGLLTLLAAVYIIFRAPEPLLRFLLLSLTKVLFRVQTIASSNIPEEGGALIISNHVSFADAFILSCATDRPIRFLILRKYYDLPILKTVFDLLHAIPISNERPSKSAVRVLNDTATCINNGELVCIFPEGKRTRTGLLEEFRRGTERIAESIHGRPVVPIYIQGLWGIPSSHKESKRFWDYFLLQRSVTVLIGSPLKGTLTAATLQDCICQLGSRGAERTSLHPLSPLLPHSGHLTQGFIGVLAEET